MGAPTVLVEKLPRAEEFVTAFVALQEHLGRELSYVVSAEAGGLNALTPVNVASALGIPLVDADGMGRAFPKLQLVTPTLYGGRVTPMTLCDERGNVVVITTPSNAWAERIARSVTVETGAMSAIALCPMTGRQLKDWLVHGALSLAQDLGRTLRLARERKDSPVEAILAHRDGRLLIEGKIADVARRTERGWNLGEATIAGSGAYAGSTLVLHFQNEHLVAFVDGVPVATVPDLIMILEAETGEPIPAEDVRYGYRVAVVGMPCDPRWRTEAGLALAGPRAFGYDVDFVPVESR
jgi:DUF917 family protein